MSKVKILIANRGEIAKRIIFACKELGFESIAIYAEDDSLEEHVKFADKAYLIGKGSAKETYLNLDKIIQIAREVKVTAIHPGYGFLSEEPEFPKKCVEEGIIFIGPSTDMMQKLGLKTESKKIADKLKIPRSPGNVNVIKDLNQAKEYAKKIGYPVMIKATGGGGGKGMRLVKNVKELKENLEIAQTEAKMSFSNSDIFIEKFIENLRHIEVQILADSFGNVVHFFERECTIQRNHQKLIEEAPSSFVTNKEREIICGYAVKFAKEIGYLGAGTVEFICDKDRNFYFCEMNTRIQVEHGITELITQFDLVKEQILVCLGKQLSVTQKDISFKGHAIECRINAENPSNNFFPSTGKIANYEPPQGEGLRIDGIVRTGARISENYDSMIMKLMSYGSNREEARKRMELFLSTIKIEGLKTNLKMQKEIISSSNFKKGNLNVNFLSENNIIEKLQNSENNEESNSENLNAAIAAIALINFLKGDKENKHSSWVLSNYF